MNNPSSLLLSSSVISDVKSFLRPRYKTLDEKASNLLIVILIRFFQYLVLKKVIIARIYMIISAIL